MVKIEKTKQLRLAQGDILRDVTHVEHVRIEQGTVELSKIIFPLALVLTQDCDLAQDHTFRDPYSQKNSQDKLLMSVLVAPMYNLEEVYSGSHLEQLGLKMNPINKNKTPGQNLIKNETPRYHHFDFPPEIQIAPSVIDFKHYFSCNVDYLMEHKELHFVCQLSDLYREDVSQRFSSFLSRIGLP